MRPDLLALDPAVLAELTNVGTARRAAKELAAGARFDFTVADEVITATDGEITCVLGTGHFGSWTCSCTAGESCRHLVRAVLQWQADQLEGEARLTAPAPGDSAAPTGSGAAPSFTPRIMAQAERIRDQGLIASLTRTNGRSRVRFFHPEHVAVRFLVGDDPRYVRCECGGAGCVHAALAAPLLEGQPADSRGWVATHAEPVPVPAALDTGWRTWLAQLLDLGLPAAAELLTGVLRLASEAESSGLVHPAAALRDVAEQLELRLVHSARLSPVRQLELIGEVAARLRVLSQARRELPPRLVAGSPPGTHLGGAVRLTGLGAEYRQVGGWHELRAYLLDTATLAIRTVTITRTDTEEQQHTPQSLAQLRRGRARMLDFAAGRGLLPRSRAVGDELVLPRGRWTMGAVNTLEVDQDLLAAGFALAVGERIPAALGPRRPADQVALAGVSEVTELGREPGRAFAVLRDTSGAEAVLRSQPDALAGKAADSLQSILSSGSVTAVAGRWRPGIAGAPPMVVPTAVWWSGGVFLPQLGLGVGENLELDQAEGGSLNADPWDQWWEEFADVLGRLLLTGARRGAAQAERALQDSAGRARELGLERCASLAERLRKDLPYPERRLGAFLEACQLLAIRE